MNSELACFWHTTSEQISPKAVVVRLTKSKPRFKAPTFFGAKPIWVIKIRGHRFRLYDTMLKNSC